MSDEIELYFEDGRGNRVTRKVKQVIDVRDFIGTPGYSLLVAAANTELSVPDIQRFLDVQARETPGVARGLNWIRRRRWLFQQPGTENKSGLRENADGKDNRAIAIMRLHARQSAHGLSLLLKEHGIARSRDWCRLHRCD